MERGEEVDETSFTYVNFRRSISDSLLVATAGGAAVTRAAYAAELEGASFDDYDSDTSSVASTGDPGNANDDVEQDEALFSDDDTDDDAESVGDCSGES